MVYGSADILEGARPAAARVPETPVFEIARDRSLAGKAGAESANVFQVIGGLPETTMNYEEEREGSIAPGKAKLSKLVRVAAV